MKKSNFDSKIKTDTYLWENLKSGEKESFEILFKACYLKLCVFSNQFTKDMDDARELVQELFVYFWENRGKLKEINSVQSYFYAALRFNSIRKSSARSEIVDLPAIELAVDFHDEMEYAELQHAIYEAIGSLSPQCRKIFRMSRFEQLTYREIANILGLSPKTVEVQISKALRILHNTLEKRLPTVLLFFFY